jgi:hypothetical protein
MTVFEHPVASYAKFVIGPTRSRRPFEGTLLTGAEEFNVFNAELKDSSPGASPVTSGSRRGLVA